MADKLRLAVLFGGQSVEHAVSVNSAVHVMAAASERFDVVPVGVTKRGAWLTPDETQRQLAAPARPFEREMVLDGGEEWIDRLAPVNVLGEVDVVFPLIHGTFGEDGTLQGLLELAGVPYVGAGVAASAIGMDKSLMKRLLRQAGIKVVDSMLIRATSYHEDPRSIIGAVEGSLGYPLFVKPANGGSSLGVSKVRSREEVGAAMCLAFQYDRKVLAERGVTAREVECAILGNDEPEASPIGEILHTHEFYDYEAKYLDADTTLNIPADIPAGVAGEIRETAVRAYRALDCAGMGRMDFFLTPDNELYLDEINTLPGFSPESMYPLLWAQAGLGYADLIARLVDLALERHRENKHGR